MIAQQRTVLDIELAREALDICWLGDGAAVIAPDEWNEEDND